jgi:hypothetical protein
VLKPDSVSQRYARFAGASALNDDAQVFRYSATGLISSGIDLRTVAGRTWAWWRRYELKVYPAWCPRAAPSLFTRLPVRPDCGRGSGPPWLSEPA